MSRQDALDLLKPFLPGLEAALADPDVSEIMINGPGNVWLEGHGRLTQIDAPALDAAALERAAIHIAPPAWAGRGHHADSRCPGWTTVRAWRSASRRPAPTSRSPSGGSAHARSRWRSWSHKARSPNTSGTWPSRPSTRAAISW